MNADPVSKTLDDSHFFGFIGDFSLYLVARSLSIRPLIAI